jgi:hypothetical protein
MAAGRRWNAASRRSSSTCGDHVPLMKRTAPGPVPKSAAARSSASGDLAAQRHAEIAVGIHAQERLVAFALDEETRAAIALRRNDAADDALAPFQPSAPLHLLEARR